MTITNPGLKAGYYRADSLGYALAGMLGVDFVDADALLSRAYGAATSRCFSIKERNKAISCTDEKCPCQGDDDPGTGFHSTTFEVSQAGELDGTWSLRCVASAWIDWDQRHIEDGIAELSRGDLRILLHFEFEPQRPIRATYLRLEPFPGWSGTIREDTSLKLGSFPGWSGVDRVWEGEAYDNGGEEAHP
jgi:hypothetical protein